MTTETITDPVTERVAVEIAREHLIGAADWNHLLPSVRVLYRECARAALAAAGVEQLRAQVERLTAENADRRAKLADVLDEPIEDAPDFDGLIRILKATFEQSGNAEFRMAHRYNDACDRAERVRDHLRSVLGKRVGAIGEEFHEVGYAHAAAEEITQLRQALSVAERHDADVRLEAESDVRAELAEKAGA